MARVDLAAIGAALAVGAVLVVTREPHAPIAVTPTERASTPGARADATLPDAMRERIVTSASMVEWPNHQNWPTRRRLRSGRSGWSVAIGIPAAQIDSALKQYTIVALGDVGAVDMQDDIEPDLNDGNCSVAAAAVRPRGVGKMDKPGFGKFFAEKGMPAMMARFDECDSAFISGLLAILPDGREMESPWWRNLL